MTDTIPELDFIKDPSIIKVLWSIKKVQERMKKPDLVNASFGNVYQTITEEFQEFANMSDSLLRSVISGDKNGLVASILYHKSKELEGKISEPELANMVAKKYGIPEL